MSKADETREFIIQKAAPLFNTYGYYGTTMSQLVRAINMTKGAIYGNFKDKEDIAAAAFEFNLAKISNEITDTLRKKKNTCDKLIAFACYYLDQFTEINDSGGCPILNAAVDSDNAGHPLKSKVAESIGGWVSNVSKIIQKGITKGEINPNTRPEQFASVFVSLVEGGIMLSKITGNTIHLSRSVDHIIYMVNTELRV